MSAEEPSRASAEAPTRVRSEEPTRVASTRAARTRLSARDSWVGLALATACGFLLGALVVTTLGGVDGEAGTVTQRVTVPGTVMNGGTVITGTRVPPMVGEPLDVAKTRATRARFLITVDSGGGVFGVVRDEN